MAAAAASGVSGIGVSVVANQKGAQGNLITMYAIADPAGATGATTLVESGNIAYLKLKNTSGAVIAATIAEMVTAFNTGRLVTASLTAAATGANTGAAFTGITLVGGASGAAGYDDLAAATGDGWILTNVAAPGDTNTSHAGLDIMEKVASTGPGAGHRVRVAGVAATGATNACKAAHAEEYRRAKLGYPRSLRKIGETGAGEYVV